MVAFFHRRCNTTMAGVAAIGTLKNAMKQWPAEFTYFYPQTDANIDAGFHLSVRNSVRSVNSGLTHLLALIL